MQGEHYSTHTHTRVCLVPDYQHLTGGNNKSPATTVVVVPLPLLLNPASALPTTIFFSFTELDLETTKESTPPLPLLKNKLLYF